MSEKIDLGALRAQANALIMSKDYPGFIALPINPHKLLTLLDTVEAANKFLAVAPVDYCTSEEEVLSEALESFYFGGPIRSGK